MKCFLAIFLCCSSLALASPQTVTRGTLISTRAYTCTTSDFGMRCDSCTEAVICNGSPTSLGIIKCESPNSYCDSTTHSCTSVKPSTCTNTAATFTCPEEGFFPNPTVCTNYYFCSAAAAIAESWACPENFVYDSLNNNCKRKVFATDCVTMKCVTANTFIVHTANPNYYAFCDKDLLATLFKCPKNMQFNGGCKFVCKAEGYYPGSTAAEYYLCAKSGLTWTVTVEKCPTGYEYNATTKNCVKV